MKTLEALVRFLVSVSFARTSRYVPDRVGLKPKVGVVSTVALLVVVAGCGGDENHAGMDKDEAGKVVLIRARQAMPSVTFPYPADAVKTKTPRGVDAWLVKVDFESHSGQVCAYAWRDYQEKTHVQWDGVCRYWDF